MRRRWSAAGATLVIATVAAAASGTSPVALAAVDGSSLTPVEPCRLYDSRQISTSPPAAGSTVRLAVVDGPVDCGVADDASAVALTVTAVSAADRGFVTAWPAGIGRPTASMLNYGVGETRANGALVKLGEGGAVELFTRAAAHLVVDVTAYFVPAAGPVSAGRFVAVGPQRLVDTRETDERLGSGGELVVTVPTSLYSGGIDAVAATVTVVETGDRTFATAYPFGAERPTTSIVNADAPGQNRAATAIVPVTDRRFVVYTRAAADVVVDITGVFTDATAEPTIDGLFVPIDPRRVIDTRTDGPRIYADGTREFAVPYDASAAVLNITATEPVGRGFWTAYPAGSGRPLTSSLNVSERNEVAANLALVPTGERGVAVFGRATAHVVVDTTGSFTGTPSPSPRAVPPNTPPPDRRVVIIGDSAMTGLRTNGALGGLRGARYETHLQTCRRLVYPSCSVLRSSAPPTALEVLRDTVAPAESDRDVLVIATGYNDWIGRFATSGQGFDDLGVIMAEARTKRFRTVVWVAMRSTEHNPGGGPSQSGFGDNADINRAVRTEAATRFPELLIWDRDRYTSAAGASAWYFADGVHQTRVGSWGMADWISRHVAALDGRPCAMPWAVGLSIESPCPVPDALSIERGGVPDAAALYGL